MPEPRPTPAELERVATVAGSVTLVVGAVLAARPEVATAALGLPGQRAVVRAIGISDLVLAPGLLCARDRAPWLLARAVLNLGDAVYLQRIASRSAVPGPLRAGAVALLGLTALDAGAGLALRARRRT